MLRRLLPFLLSILALVTPLSATWSIILIDTRTGEIAVGCATCITNFNLLSGVPVIVVGKGAAAAQSLLDDSGVNRLLIRDQLRLSTDPVQILALLAAGDVQHQTRQYGIVDVTGRAVGFTGSGDGAYASDRVGRIGDIAYAIQGNVLTSGAVLAAAEIALFTTNGDLGEKLMAMMDAARSYGGDGRCSCTAGTPTSCGSPPPGFTKSSHVAFMVVARRGDTDGGCNQAVGCAAGSYYMNLNVTNGLITSPDPVLQLRTLLDSWRRTQVGVPDHYLSTVTLANPNLPLDGVSRTTATLVLRDREGTQVPHGGANVGVVVDPTSAGNARVGTVRDMGDGTYEFDVIAGTLPLSTALVVTVNDGSGPRILSPNPRVGTDLNRLWVSRTVLSANQGGTLQFSLQTRGIGTANRVWILLGSMSGTTPGILIPPGFRLPLNPDDFLTATAAAIITGSEPALFGRTSPSGLALTALTFPPGVYTIPIGTDISFAYALIDPLTLISNAVTVHIGQ